MSDENPAADQLNKPADSSPEMQGFEPANPPKTTQPNPADEFQDVKKELSGYERATLRWTIVIVAVNALTCLFIFLQWLEMKSGSVDTHTLAEQAITQATQTTNLATETKNLAIQTTNLAAAMGKQADSTHTLVIQAAAQAKAAQEVATATQRSADAANNSARITQQQLLAFEATEAAQLIVNITPAQEPNILQAQIDIQSDSILIDWDVAPTNVGPTVAKGLSFSASVFDIAGTNGNYAEPPGRPFSRLAPTPSSVGRAIKQNDTEHFKFTQQIPGWESVVNRKDTIVIYMQVSYLDIFNRPQFAPTCVYFDLGTKGFIRCP